MEDVLRELLGILRPNELLIIRSTDVNECPNWVRSIRGMKRMVVDGVSVDLTDIEILLYLCHLIRLDAIGYTPDLFGCGLMVVLQGLPV